MSAKRQIKLGVSMIGMGYHLAAWRHPDASAAGNMELKHFVKVTQTAERGLLDMAFLADGVGIRFNDRPPGALSHTRGDKQLHLGCGEDHRADIPPIQHGALRGAEAALKIEQGRAHGGDGGDLARRHIGQGTTQIAPCEVFWRQGAGFDFGDAGILGVYAAIQNAPANSAI